MEKITEAKCNKHALYAKTETRRNKDAGCQQDQSIDMPSGWTKIITSQEDQTNDKKP